MSNRILLIKKTRFHTKTYALLYNQVITTSCKKVVKTNNHKTLDVKVFQTVFFCIRMHI